MEPPPPEPQEDHPPLWLDVPTDPEDGSSPVTISPDLPLEEQIHAAARHGHTAKLHALLGERAAPEQAQLLHAQIKSDDGERTSPLIAAARYGHYKAVQLLLSRFRPDLEITGTVKFGHYAIEGASALWAAAGAGHFKVVEALIHAGADVNHMTKIRSTPLRAACFEGRLDIVKLLMHHGADLHLANEFNNTCLMIASFKGHLDVVRFLLNEGADPNVAAKCGETALHFAAEVGHVAVVKALLMEGARILKNGHGMTPLISAAERCQAEIVEYMIGRPEVSKLERIDALELLGASFANDRENYDIRRSFQYLLQAMQERWSDLDNVICKRVCPSIPAYDDHVECEAPEDLIAIEADDHALHMESLAIRERILGSDNPEVPHPVIFRGAVFADSAQFDKCLQLWFHALRLRRQNCANVARDLLRFAQVFSQIVHVGLNVEFDQLLEVISACQGEIKRNLLESEPSEDTWEELESNMNTFLYFLVIYGKTRKNTSETDHFRLMKLVYEAVELKPLNRRGQTLLHLAVHSETPVDEFHTNALIQFPCSSTTKLLIEAGADVGAMDAQRNTPLHCIVTYQRVVNDFITLHTIITVLVGAGAHTDVVNLEGKTPLQAATTGVAEIILKGQARLTLKCLAAQSVKKHRLTYQGQVPEALETFIELHGP